jgi:serine acetyltransferase
MTQDVIVNHDKFRTISNKATIHDTVTMGCFIEIRDRCIIGEGTKLGSFIVLAADTWIGKNCLIHANAIFADDPKLDGNKVAPRLENNVKLGARVTIVGDVTIGDGAIIGANSYVNKSVPPGEIWAGTPARKLRSSRPLPSTGGTLPKGCG